MRNSCGATSKQQRAALDQIQLRLRQTQIRAPFGGRIAERYSNPGMTIAPGTPIVRLISGHELLARFAAPLGSAGELAAGKRITIAIPSLERTLSGTISRVGSEIDAASGMIIGEAEVLLPDDWDGPPLSGQTVRVHLTY